MRHPAVCLWSSSICPVQASRSSGALRSERATAGVEKSGHVGYRVGVPWGDRRHSVYSVEKLRQRVGRSTTARQTVWNCPGARRQSLVRHPASGDFASATDLFVALHRPNTRSTPKSSPPKIRVFQQNRQDLPLAHTPESSPKRSCGERVPISCPTDPGQVP